MHLFDWSVVIALLALMTYAAYHTKKYNKSVADFLAANRCAGRYLICVAQGIAGVGAISIVANFEMYYKAGFSAVWWQLIWLVVTIIVTASGWVLYRFRQTRALTVAQFLEIRYSKKFRIFAGLISYLSGIVNFGIFPSVGARFIIYYCGFPDTLLVYMIVLAILLVFALFFTFWGGQVAIIITDFIQGTFCNIVFVVVIALFIYLVGWSRIVESLLTAPEQSSMLHPFHTKDAEDFNLFFFLIISFGMIYGHGVWQGSQGYFTSATSAHESRMGHMLSSWRQIATTLFMMILPICAYTILNHPDFVEKAELIQPTITNIKDSQIQEQMITPLVMKNILPVGIKGAIVAVMLAAFISTHDTYLHSWGSIFIQDVIMPFRKKPISPKLHIYLLRFSILGVAIFIYCFSIIFKQTDYILMFFYITGAIYVGGAGAVIIGGLYWKKGTTLAAWFSMITGSIFALAAIVIRQINEYFPFQNKIISFVASQNGAVLSFYASILAISVYVLVSLCGKKTVFNMDKMLHRGKYTTDGIEKVKQQKPVNLLHRIIGMSSEFTLTDKIIYLATLIWTGLMVMVFMIGLIYNIFVDVGMEAWITFWKYYVLVIFIFSVITTIWFLFGGLLNLKEMFTQLKTQQRDDTDDGTVIDENTDSEIIDL